MPHKDKLDRFKYTLNGCQFVLYETLIDHLLLWGIQYESGSKRNESTHQLVCDAIGTYDDDDRGYSDMHLNEYLTKMLGGEVSNLYAYEGDKE